MPKKRVKTGEEREVNRTLNIDLLPQAAKDAILYLRDRGETWPLIEEQSARQYSEKWKDDGGGFIRWEDLETRVLERFPDLRLPKSSLHRWYDLRIDQVRKQVLKESAQAREFASAFASQSLPDANAAVMNAMRDQVFLLIKDVGQGDQVSFLKGLNGLALTMSRLQRVDLQARRVEADIAKSEAQRAQYAAEAGEPREIYLLASQDLLKKLRSREQVRAVIDSIKEELIQEFSHGADEFARQVEARASR